MSLTQSMQGALHPLDQPVHLENLLVSQGLAFGNDFFTLVVQHRYCGMERVRLARGYVSLSHQHVLLNRRRHFGAKAIDLDHALAHATPNATTFPVATFST